jgi:hypothetical protein
MYRKAVREGGSGTTMLELYHLCCEVSTKICHAGHDVVMLGVKKGVYLCPGYDGRCLCDGNENNLAL